MHFYILKLSDCIMLVRLETFFEESKDETFKLEVKKLWNTKRFINVMVTKISTNVRNFKKGRLENSHSLLWQSQKRFEIFAFRLSLTFFQRQKNPHSRFLIIVLWNWINLKCMQLVVSNHSLSVAANKCP